MVGLVQKYQADPVPSDPASLPEYLRQELDRIALAMRGRDEVVCGKATLSSGTAAVTLAREQPDSEYFILLCTDTDENVWRSAKATTGFTINGGAAGASVVHWAIFRDRDND